ncbi:DNA-directed RNA polymerase subunit beta [Companilactobacillus baiquanensis]|uniref:DNA-directed RNA polymerase subunit beta n=1 Tax=Companilactobacillus baiquanensis TaxID=2486005 RepID=A0ABW1UXM0_9LACO|nr:DNA-directed RNA polymerase subunit beta [Companilactobacillus baiquanensis]
MKKDFGREYRKDIFRKIGWVFLLILIFFILGMLIGSALGGSNPLAVLWPGTWIHMIDFLR